MSDDLTIRRANGSELDVVASLIVDAYSEFAAQMSPDAWSAFAQDIANVRGRLFDGEVLVAERAGRMVGTVTRFPYWRGAQQGALTIKLLAVPPHERGTGVGRRLIEHCIGLARKEGKERVVCTITQEMENAQDLYDKLGFVREPALDHMPAPGVHAIGYGLKLE